MNPEYVEASLPFMPAAQRMFAGKFDARPDTQIADDFRRDDVLAIPIAWDAEHGAAGGRFSNEDLAKLCAQFPDVFLPGWGMVDPWRGRKGLEEIEYAIKTLGLLGIKYQPPVQDFSPHDKQFYPIWDLLQSLGAPVLIHCGTTAIGAGEPGGLGFKLNHARPIPNIDNVAADFPKLNIIAAHPGWPWTEEKRFDRHFRLGPEIHSGGTEIRHAKAPSGQGAVRLGLSGLEPWAVLRRVGNGKISSRRYRKTILPECNAHFAA
jgi:hypothetical protein